MDFTLARYQKYLNSIISKYTNILRFDEFFQLNIKNSSICLIRHDVDRKPKNALKMAYLENKLGIKASYYFRIKKNSFNPKIIKKISELGHEIGYHYENLSDTYGNIDKAMDDFISNLKKFRKIVEVKTISMHGRPFRPYDNRDLWRIKKNHLYLKNELKILGALYLDIDYKNIAYINDTGRNWKSNKSNLRDGTNSQIEINFADGNELLKYLSNSPYETMIFQIHPERWSDNFFEWIFQLIIDRIINMIKYFISIVFKK